jgi:hypothetical protein
MKIILINGKKRAGKDFFAKLLQDEFYKNKKSSCIMGFADPIKEIISKTLNISLSDLDTFKNTKEKIIVQNQEITDFRQVLQTFGTEAMKSIFGEGVWVKLFLSRAHSSNVDYVIVSDFRFISEEISDITVHIQNDEIDYACEDSHASENELNYFKFKYTIDNSGYRDIEDDVKIFVKDILNG